MSGNSSSSNDSLHPSLISSIKLCLSSRPNSFIFTTSIITSILLLLPLCIFILHHGLQLRRQKRSTSSAVTVSHSDVFTYHVVVMELVGLFSCVPFLCVVYWGSVDSLLVAVILYSINFSGQSCFHVLTCVERYLAVVHPITYLSLRNQRGIRIRNISIACVWMFSFGGLGMMWVKHSVFISFSISLISLAVISFCSLSVLCVLIRPGPGEQGGGRERADQSKKRAFYTIMSILGVLVLRFICGLILAVLVMSGRSTDCVVKICEYWFNLPSSLVLPLLFLQRAGKLVCCKKNIQ